jgi:hypothetical protein
MHEIPRNIGMYDRKVFSQNGEDGILECLYNALQIKSGYFVEFGIAPPWTGTLEANGLEGNCCLLRECGWTGLFMDGGKYPPEYDVKSEFITALNINVLLKKYECPEEIDVFSIDVDGQDFWIWMNLDRRPKIVIIEYNRDFESDESFTVPFQLDFIWSGTRYFGASLLAMCKLGESKHYRPVYANGINVFFVRDDLVLNKEDFPLRPSLPKERLHGDDNQNRPWVAI